MYTRYNTQKPVKGTSLRPDNHWSKIGLVGCWLMNEGAGNKVFDLSGYKADGTFHADGPAWGAGVYGSCIKFSGVGGIDMGVCPSNLQLTHDPGFTVVVSLKAIDEYGYICGNDINTPNAGWGLSTFTDSNFRISHGSSPEYSPVNTFVSGEQLTIAYVINGLSADWYKNGQLYEAEGSSASIAASSQHFTIGVDPRDQAGLEPNSDIDYIYIFNYPLTAFEIALLYREPFCMFKKEPIELWSAATQGEAPSGNAGIMTCNTGYWGATY
jgi:hypothetical protein